MENILFEIQSDVAKITLNRPDKLNSFNRAMSLELISALKQAEGDDCVRAILLTGAGRGFCAGQDLSEAVGDDAYEIEDIIEKQYNPIVKLLRGIEKPIVCAVNGVAAGAGANIAFACDITIASSDAKFIQSFAAIGLIPDTGGTFYLPRMIGMQNAAALMMTGDRVTADRARELGLIYDVAPAEKLMENTTELAQKLALMPTKGIGLTKRSLNESMSNSFDEQLNLEQKLQKEASESYDYNEGVSAFLEKRKPNFKGK
jgi:2-(1,2-epoxy-1,2-dihydrophenyl)acetyl-CoA isomerase